MSWGINTCGHAHTCGSGISKFGPVKTYRLANRPFFFFCSYTILCNDVELWDISKHTGVDVIQGSGCTGASLVFWVALWNVGGWVGYYHSNCIGQRALVPITMHRKASHYEDSFSCLAQVPNTCSHLPEPWAYVIPRYLNTKCLYSHLPLDSSLACKGRSLLSLWKGMHFSPEGCLFQLREGPGAEEQEVTPFGTVTLSSCTPFPNSRSGSNKKVQLG